MFVMPKKSEVKISHILGNFRLRERDVHEVCVRRSVLQGEPVSRALLGELLFRPAAVANDGGVDKVDGGVVRVRDVHERILHGVKRLDGW